MVARRQMLGTTGIAGIAATMWPRPDAADAPQSSEKALADVASEIDDLRKEIASQRNFPELGAVREQQRNFVRATGKYPDFIEVGVDVWQGIYDWHVRWHQPISLARDPNGRYTISLLVTTIVLRPDTVPNYIGAPYDSK
jgi:hypothetical protein